jgi:hypothetical protein
MKSHGKNFLDKWHINKFSVKSLKHKPWAFLCSVIFYVLIVNQKAPRH